MKLVGWFLVIGSGETFNSRVAHANELLDAVIDMIYGETANCPESEREEWERDLLEPDQWHHDYDTGPTEFHQDIGETDLIRVIRITEISSLFRTALNKETP